VIAPVHSLQHADEDSVKKMWRTKSLAGKYMLKTSYEKSGDATEDAKIFRSLAAS
jgi:hypothetical protein